ncbi:MAG: ABC transporter permease [Candidatus Magasanikbacteria bacterium]|nr:ABC transporter permease [Candidatus Magasanikbacteria bacterium]
MNLTPVNLAYASIRRQRRRAILTMLAISIGISAVITIIAAGKGMQRLVLGQLEVFGPGTISIEVKVPSAKQGSSDNAVGLASGIVITTMKDRDLRDILKHPNIEAAYGMVSGQEAVSYGGQIKKTVLFGYGASAPEVEKFTVAEGRYYSKEEEESLATVAVLGSKAREKLFGDEDPIGKNIYIRGKTYRVVGVMASRGSAFFIDMDDIILIPTKTMQKKLLGIDYVPHILAKLKDNNQTASTVEDLKEILRSNHLIADPSRDDFAIDTMADATKTLSTVTEGVTLLLVALVCVSLLVGGVGIMNIMYVSVAERTFEIGLRKALGARKKDILWQFLAEAILVTLGGGVAGIILGAILALIVYLAAESFGLQWVYVISLSSVILAVSFSAFIGLLFGLYPARRAAALNPIEALRKE